MSCLFLGQLQKIDAVIEDRRKHIEVAQQHVKQLQASIEAAQQYTRSLQIDIEEQEECRRKILASKEFCESVLSQVRTALVMLHRLDESEITAFERAIRNQFRLDPSYLLAEDTVVKLGQGFAVENSPTFVGIPTVPVASNKSV